MSDKRFSDNPYYSPEKCGLKVIDSIEGDLSYEFDMVVVWQDLKSKKYYWGSDSGCSCPTPFEDIPEAEQQHLRDAVVEILAQPSGVLMALDKEKL